MVLPFSFLSFGIIHEGQHLAFMIAFVAILAAQVKNNWITVFFWYLCAWMIFICIMRMIYGLPPVVFARAMEQFIFMAAGLSIFIAVWKSEYIKFRTFYNIICIAALIQACIAIAQRLKHDPVSLVLNLFTVAQPLLPETFPVGTLGNNNFLAAFLAISLPFFFRKNWFYGLILIVPCILLCNTSAAVVPAIVGTIFFFHRKTDLLYLMVIAALLCLGGAYYAFVYHPSILDITSQFSRWKLWAIALQQIFSSPFSIICGFGPGAGWGQAFPMHNEFLQCWHHYGLIGLSLLLGYVLTVFWGNKMLLTAFIIAVINMLGNYSLHLAPSVFLIIIIAGLMEREKWSVTSS